VITRRAILKSLALTGGAAACGGLAHGQAPAAPAEPEQVFKLPPLGYDYDALEPLIDAETMKLHHDKHHAGYVSKLNQALAKLPGMEKSSVEELLGKLQALPAEIRDEVRNQGGGHANHSLFWQILKKTPKARPAGELSKQIEKAFGSYDDFWKLFSATAMGIFGSGWAWLVWRERKLVIEQTANQDSPYLTAGLPLLGLDVWEHAYYLGYQNRRAEYVGAFEQLINWDYVGERFGKYAI
jgi:Fe-Mn family superoxide dismutase